MTTGIIDKLPQKDTFSDNVLNLGDVVIAKAVLIKEFKKLRWLALSSELQKWKFHVRKCAARAARLVILIQPIKSLVYGVAVAVVIS